jgi:hypothetical protein
MAVALDASLNHGPALSIRPLNRTRLFRSVRFVSESLGLDLRRHNIRCQPLNALQKELAALQSASSFIVVTTPPHQLDLATRTVAQALQFQTKGAQRNLGWMTTNLEIVILGNGLVSSSTLEILQTISAASGSPKITWHRGLVVVGLASEWNPQTHHLHITHTGGQTVYCGRYDSLNVGCTPPKPLLRGPVFHPVPVGPIRALELQKFFTNTLLAWAIGPSAQVNAASLTLLTTEHALDLAHDFACLFPEAGPAEEIVQFFWATVQETPNNINSASTAWRDGDPGLAYYFRDTVLDAWADQKKAGHPNQSALSRFFTLQPS